MEFVKLRTGSIVHLLDPGGLKVNLADRPDAKDRVISEIREPITEIPDKKGVFKFRVTRIRNDFLGGKLDDVEHNQQLFELMDKITHFQKESVFEIDPIYRHEVPQKTINPRNKTAGQSAPKSGQKVTTIARGRFPWLWALGIAAVVAYSNKANEEEA